MPESVWFTCERCGHYKGRMVVSDSRQMCLECEIDINEGGPVVLLKSPEQQRDDVARRLMKEAGVIE